jgi:hypothetical protein
VCSQPVTPTSSTGAPCASSAPPGPVLARTRGAPGYQERRNSRIDLELQAWARDMSTADDLLARALAAVLATVSGLDVIDLSSAPPHLSLRLTGPG